MKIRIIRTYRPPRCYCKKYKFSWEPKFGEFCICFHVYLYYSKYRSITIHKFQKYSNKILSQYSQLRKQTHTRRISGILSLCHSKGSIWSIRQRFQMGYSE